MFFVCIFSLFNIINIVSYIEIISVFNDFSYYRQYAPTKDNKIVSPVTIIKNISIFWSLRIPHLASFKGYVSDVIGRRYDKVKNGHIFENWTSICGLDVVLSLTYLINHVSASKLTWFIIYLLQKVIVPL